MIRNPFRDLDHKKLTRSSDVLQKQNDYYKIVNRRIVIFGIIISILFLSVFFKLTLLQTRDYDKYSLKLANISSSKQISQPPRGEIYDRNGKIIVKTVSAHNITYFPPSNTTDDEKWELAQKFSRTFEVKDDFLSKSDLQDMYLYLYRDPHGKKDTSGNHLLTENELKGKLKSEEKDKLVRSRITEQMINSIASKREKKAYSVYLAMNRPPADTVKVIIEDASDEDVAYLLEHKHQFEGFDVDFSSWKREYPYKDTLRDVLGSVSSSNQGIPLEEQDYYNALGYPLNSRVGTSGLEKEYESLLSGSFKTEEMQTTSDGEVNTNELTSGKKGYNLHLTIDIDLQVALDKIMTDVIKRYAGTKDREAFNQAFVTLIDPNTGEVLAMSGAIKNEDKDVYKFASGNYLNNYPVGSAVKGATVYMVLNEGVITPKETVMDEKMNIAGDVIGSYQNYGPVDAEKALAVSSNVYMWQSIIKLAGGVYKYGQPLQVSQQQTNKTLELMRHYYSMFGLGTKTGIDVPNEALGVTGYTQTAGNLLDYSIGQYDTYSPIQLAQYVSTVANGGKKLQPKLVNYATEVNSDYVVYQNKTKTQSVIEGNLDYLKVVKNGFRECVATNHCGVSLNALDKDVAAKTGTAQTEIWKDGSIHKYTNATIIGFAPYDKPKIAFTASAPTSADDTHDLAANICVTEIIPRVLEEYFKKYN